LSVSEMQDTLQKHQTKKSADPWWAFMRIVVVVGVDYSAKENYEVKLE
jgi:hypothetical protein